MENGLNTLARSNRQSIFTSRKVSKKADGKNAIKGEKMVINLVSALGEIRTHAKVKRIDFPKKNELQISFVDTYADLLIPIRPEMDSNLLVGIFYNYLNLPESKLARA